MRMYSSALVIKWEFHLLHILPNTAHTHGKKKKKRFTCHLLLSHNTFIERQTKGERKKRGGYGGREKGNKLREREREVTATVWWSLTQEFSLRSREAVEDEADTQARLCVQVPPRCPARFHPPSTPTLPRQPRLLSTNQGTGGRRHSGDTSKRFLGERLRADAGTTQRSTEESRDGQLEKRSPNGMEKRSLTRTKHFILFTNQHYASRASKNPDTFFSLPWANGPLEYVNKGDNLIKKIQSSSLREQS